VHDFIEMLRKDSQESITSLSLIFIVKDTDGQCTEVYEKALSLRDLFQETDLIRRLHNGNVTMNNRADFVGQVCFLDFLTCLLLC
jgi:hypothetical protein